MARKRFTAEQIILKMREQRAGRYCQVNVSQAEITPKYG